MINMITQLQHPQYNTGRTWFKKGHKGFHLKGFKNSGSFKKGHDPRRICPTEHGYVPKHTIESKKKISEKLKGIKKPWLSKLLKGRKLSAEHIKKLSGKNSRFWKGGITPINIKIRQSAKYSRGRTAVLERDDFT